MKDIIERMMAVEKRAREILDTAEQESQRSLEDARGKIRRTSEEVRFKAVEDARKIVEDSQKNAQDQKAEQLEKARMESLTAER